MWSDIRESIRRATAMVELVLDVTGGTQNPDS